MTAVKFVAPLARALTDQSCRVEFATGPGRGVEDLEAQGFVVHQVPISRNVLDWRNREAIRSLRRLLVESRFDIVHAHTPAAATIARLAARRVNTWRFYTMHGSLWGTGVASGRQAFYTLLERLLGKGTDTIFTVNPEDASDCVDRARVDASKVITLPAGGAGVDPEFFADDATAKMMRHEVREEFALEPHHTVITYVGRTTASKGLGVLARAFRRLCQQQANVKLVVVGEALRGDRRPYTLERFRREVGSAASPHVIWTGFRYDVPAMMAAADLVVLPSFREGFGMSLAEAAAMGRPVVASETRGARAVIEAGMSGLLVPVGDHIGLAEAVLGLIREPERRVRMGKAAKDRAAARFTRAAVIQKYLQRYGKLALSNGDST